MNYIFGLIAILLAYLVGSFPSALVIGKLFYNGIDIREHGSGNLGGSNALRVLGKRGGLVVYILDILKGGVAVLIAVHLQSAIAPLIVALFALIGHIYPIFAGFKGGKAVATSAGVVLFYAPISFLILAVIFFGSLSIWKMISVSSVASSVTMFLLTVINPLNNDNLNGPVPFVVFGLFMVLIVVKHMPNYKRIANGTEPKITDKFEKPAKN